MEKRKLSTEADKFIEAAKHADFSILNDILSFDSGLADTMPQGYPAWVIKCARKVAQANYPKVYDGMTNLERKAYGAGIAWGMMRGGELKLAVTLGKGMPEATTSQHAEALKLIYGENFNEITPPEDGSLIAKEIVFKIRRIEAELDLKELADFHQGAADALRMISGENKSTETTQIYSLMVTFWRVVESLPTADAFFDLAQKSLGQNVVGSDPKRIAQMCIRVGKKFRAPGRPRKTTSERKTR